MPADTVGHLEALLKECETPPMVNQIECHTKSAQRELVSYCQERSIAITAYSPISGAVSRTIIAGTWPGLSKIPAMVVRTGTEHAALQLGHRFPRNRHRVELLGLGDEREGAGLHM